jgi:hypothetical protein
MIAIQHVEIPTQKVSIVSNVQLKKILYLSFSILQSLTWFDITFMLQMRA